MWSGNMGGHGESYPTQWALNPSAQYLHMPHEQVDWARLAQQWIKMKEEGPPEDVKEGGEAPMEITKDDMAPATSAVLPAQASWPTPTIPTGGENTLDWWTAAGWAGGAAAFAGAYAGALDGTVDPSTFSQYTPTAAANPPQATPLAPAPTHQEYTPPPPPHLSNYWNEVRMGGGKEESGSWESRNHRKHSSHHAPTEPSPEIDAVKRKQLPAWIREGLEKMEREKLKKAEQDRLDRERKEAMHLLPPSLDSKPPLDGNGYEEPPKSKFESDSSDSEEKTTKPIEESRPRKSRFDIREPSPPPKPVFRTKEQILQAVMTDVRKILTYILMEVTSEEIKKACGEVQRHFSKKAPATALRKTPALTSLTGKLGLGIYGSDSESEESGDEKVTNDPDSDEELRDKIKRLKSEFIAREKSIERECEEQEERERRQLLRERKASSEEADPIQVHSHTHQGVGGEKETPSGRIEGGSEERKVAGVSVDGTGVEKMERREREERKDKEERREREEKRESKERRESRDKREKESRERERSEDRRRTSTSSSSSSSTSGGGGEESSSSSSSPTPSSSSSSSTDSSTRDRKRKRRKRSRSRSRRRRHHHSSHRSGGSSRRRRSGSSRRRERRRHSSSRSRSRSRSSHRRHRSVSSVSSSRRHHRRRR